MAGSSGELRRIENDTPTESMRSELLRRVASEPIFRVCDDTGAWINPFTEKAVDSINLFEQPWGPAIQSAIVDLLMASRDRAYKAGWRTSVSVSDLERAAGQISAQRMAQKEQLAAQREIQTLRQHVTQLNLKAVSADAMNRELEDARQIQLRMLPQALPKIPGYDIAAFYEACIAVGGDLYQFFDAGPGRTGFVIGDVSGHGVPAAVIMSAALKSFSVRSQGAVSPAAVMAAVNQDLVRDMHKGRFISAFYAILEHATGRLCCARAGHPPVLLVNSADGSCQELKGRGLALGLGKPELFSKSLEEYEVVIPPDGLVLLYTDGIPEAMNAESALFGDKRLRDAVLSCAGLPAEKILSFIVAAVRKHTGACRLADDMTLVAVARKQC